MVFLDGAFLSERDARVSAFDAGLQHGVGLFETLTGGVRDGDAWALQLDQHLERLVDSARELELSRDLRAPALGDAVLETIRRAGHERARVRLTISGGDLNLLSRPAPGAAPANAPREHAPTVMIHAQPATEYPEPMFERGVVVAIADLRVNPLDPTQGHKTLNYWARLRELQKAGARGAAEALVFQVTNHLAGGCVSSAVLVKGSSLITPIARGEEHEVARRHDPARPPRDDDDDQPNDDPALELVPAPESADPAVAPAGPPGAVLPSPVLPGTVRAWVLEWGARRGLRVERRMVTIDDVLGADELLLTNSSWGVLPVVAVERERIGPRDGASEGPGEPGAIARALRAAWLESLGPGPDDEL